MTLTRDQSRSARKRDTRCHTVSVKRLAKRDLLAMAQEYPPDELAQLRPRTRAECAIVNRPCPFVSCRYHLYLDVSSRTGAIKLNFPDLEVEDLPESCALDVADMGGLGIEPVGELLNLTRERVRQIEHIAMAKVGPLLGAACPEVFGGEAGSDRFVETVAIDAEHAMQFGEETAA